MNVSSSRIRVLVSGMMLVGAGACDGPPPTPIVERPPLQSCPAAFEEVLDLGIHESAPAHLTWDRGVLYYSDSDGIQAVPLDGGPPSTLVTARVRAFWIAGDHLLFVVKGDQLNRVPLGGGDPTVLFDGQTVETPPAYAFSTNQALDDDYLYWDRAPQNGEPWGVWRLRRAGGAPEMLAALPPRDPPYAWPLLTLTPDSVVEALDSQASAYVVAKQGGAAHAIARPTAGTATLMGSGPGGVLWSVYAGKVRGDGWEEIFEVRRSTLDGSSQQAAPPFWVDKPPTMNPMVLGSWPDAAGGWIVTGSEGFDDASLRQTIWAVDALGNGTRLGCDLTAASNQGFVASIAVAPDAIYAVAARTSDRSSYFDYSLVRIDL